MNSHRIESLRGIIDGLQFALSIVCMHGLENDVIAVRIRQQIELIRCELDRLNGDKAN